MSVSSEEKRREEKRREDEKEMKRKKKKDAFELTQSFAFLQSLMMPVYNRIALLFPL